MGRNPDRDTKPSGFGRESVRGITYDRGETPRDASSGRDYPGSRGRRDPHYSRGPYAPSGMEPPDYHAARDAYDHRRRDEGDEPPLGQGPVGAAYGRAGRSMVYGDQIYESGYSAPYTEPWSVPGPHAGRGPGGYRRSEARIQEDVCDRLTQHGYLDASDIEVRVENDEVTLEGMVDSREAKRLAEALASEVPGVWDVHNHLRVRR